uniref:hypothetical protein n=1 Tax=Polaribacter sp. TaxID=1920175 RepID=UPI0040480093
MEVKKYYRNKSVFNLLNKLSDAFSNLSCFRIAVLISLFFSFLSCSEDDYGIEQGVDIDLKYNLKLAIESDSVKLDMGAWMFKDKIPDKNFIANWLNTKVSNKTILEPINIVWVDLKAQNKTQAISNIVRFLELNGFVVRVGSSTGYYGFFENFEWVMQYPETWSDNPDPRTVNNHGRVFLAHKISTKLNRAGFISSGAFSIESSTHSFISFGNALDQFKEVAEWNLSKDNLDMGNIIHSESYSTFDHRGTKVFVIN